MTRVRIAGAVLLVLLGLGLLTRITNRAGLPPKNPARSPVEILAEEKLLATDTVDLRNGNLHVENPDPGCSPENRCAAIRPLSRVRAGGVPGQPGRVIRERVRGQAGTPVLGDILTNFFFSCGVWFVGRADLWRGLVVLSW
jgi:hypothetical protein